MISRMTRSIKKEEKFARHEAGLQLKMPAAVLDVMPATQPQHH